MKSYFVAILLIISSCSTVQKTRAQVSYIKENSTQYDGVNFPSELTTFIKSQRLVLIGESHGTVEFPETTNRIINTLASSKKIIVGLEFPIDIQSSINEFIKTGNESILKRIHFFAEATVHSGRGSRAMINLLKNLRKNNHVEVFCFDVSSDFKGSDRDEQMAKNVFNKLNHSKKDMVVLTGNIHSRLTLGVPWDPNFKTMGSEILKISSGALNTNNSTNIIFKASQGSAWQCQSQDESPIVCKDYSFGPYKADFATAVSYAFYFMKEPDLSEGHFNSIFIRNVNPSEPNF